MYSLKYIRSRILCCEDIGIRISEFLVTINFFKSATVEYRDQIKDTQH